jgi:threonine dehydrogenase-like Zn-dependent dehydrogenase
VDDLLPPRAREVIVVPETGCLCGSDIAYFSEAQPSYPLAVGLSLHEIVGRVAESSSGDFQSGDRVLAFPPNLLGLFERLRLADDRLVRIDDGIGNDAAVIAQPMATVLSALSTLPNVIGARVAVVGQGPIGLLFNACLSNLGAGQIIGIDVLEPRVARSCHFGATDSICTATMDPVAAVTQLTGGAMADLVVEAVGHLDQAFNLCVDLCRDGGRLLYFGVPPDRLQDVRWIGAFRKSLTIHTSVPNDLRPFAKIALRWIRQGRIDPSGLITHRYRFSDSQRAFEVYRDRSDGALKVLLDFA